MKSPKKENNGCWYKDKYGNHCWQTIPNETGKRCGFCGEMTDEERDNGMGDDHE